LIRHRAAWVLPIARPPIRNGWVLTSAGRIRACGSDSQEPPADPPFETIDHGHVAILPGLVNAHTHLELSWMRDQLPPGDSMPAWAARLMALRGTVGSEPREPMRHAVREARAAGTSLVGDVTNTLAAYDALADSGLAGAVFRELLGFNAPDPAQIVATTQGQLDALRPIEQLRPSIVPHAPYSVSPELFRAIARAAVDKPLSVHLGESPDEIRFLQNGTGAWRELLGKLGAWNDAWRPPACGPAEYLERMGLVNERLLAVHCTHMNDSELGRLARAGSTIVTCPRSNAWTGAGTPPIERFFASGARVAIGTDSLASVRDLNVFTEMAEVRRLAPAVPAARILSAATSAGAAALGFGNEFGAIQAGRRADLIAVRLPRAIDDVEEYLVSGIEPDVIRWLDTA
jgi:cytosine/adenosine deaminase-related metal-dependent hydrolase